MGDIGTSTLLLAISILPGYFFCIFLSRVNFSTGRGAPSRISFLFPSIFFSLLIILVSDVLAVKNIFICYLLPLLSDFEIYSELQNAAKLPLLSLVAAALTKSPEVGDAKTLGSLIALCLFYLAPLSLVFTVAVSFVFKAAEAILRGNLGTAFIFTYLVLELVIRTPLLLISKISKKVFGKGNFNLYLNKIKRLLIIAVPTWIVGLGFLLLFIIGVAVVVVVSIGLIIVVVPLALLASLVQFLVSLIFSVFRHPSEKLFNRHSFSGIGTCIVEALDNTETLYKGRYVSFEPKSADEIDSITLDNIIQYKKNDNQKFFNREGGRKINKFHNHNSRITLLLKDIKNFNVWFLDYNNFSIDIEITNKDSLKNYFWYLDLIVRENLFFFSFEKLKPKMGVDLIADFFYELSSTLNQRYKGYFWTYKRARIRKEYLKLLHAHLRMQRVAAKGMHPKHQARLLEKRKTLIRSLRRSFKS